MEFSKIKIEILEIWAILVGKFSFIQSAELRGASVVGTFFGLMILAPALWFIAMLSLAAWVFFRASR